MAFLKAPPAQLDLWAQQVHRDLSERQVLKDHKVSVDHRAPPAQPDRRDLRDRKERKDHKVRKVKTGQL